MEFFGYIMPKDGPVVEGLEKREVTYAKTQEEYIPLRTLRLPGERGEVVSRWSPTLEQRKAIAEGADIFLTLLTFHGPLQPIRMAVGAEPATFPELSTTLLPSRVN